MTVKPIRESEIREIERSIGDSRKEREAVALIRLMRDIPLCGPVAASRLTWADIAALPGGEGAVAFPDSNIKRRWWVSPVTLNALTPLRGLPGEPVFPGRGGRPLSASALTSRIASICSQAGLGEGYGSESPRAGTEADARAAGRNAPPRHYWGAERPSGERGGGSVRFHPVIADFYARRPEAGESPLAAAGPPAALWYRRGIVVVRCGPPARSETVRIDRQTSVRVAAGRLAGVEVTGIRNWILASGSPRSSFALAEREWGPGDADCEFAEHAWPATVRLAERIVEKALRLHRMAALRPQDAPEGDRG